MKTQLPAHFLKLPLRKITPRTLDELYKELGRKPGRGASTVHHYHRLLRAAFNQALRWELLDRNPATLARPPKVIAADIEPPALASVRAVIELAKESQNPENALAFRLAAATGCRRGEVCGLRWSDVDAEASKVTIRRSVVQADNKVFEKDTKAHQQRTVTLDRVTAELLEEHRSMCTTRAADFEVALPPSAFVFSDAIDGSTPIPPDRLTQAWQRLASAAGVDARLHDLRHLQASILLDAGESVTTVAARLGHRDTATTLRVYSHLMPRADQRAADIAGTIFDDDQ